MSGVTFFGFELPPIPPRPSTAEAEHYYHGLPSKPRLTARTGPPWYPPSGPEPYFRNKELGIPGQHRLLSGLWEDNLAFKVHNILEHDQVDWSSTDIVRIVHGNEPASDGYLVLWIGVWGRHTHLSYEVGTKVVVQCRQLLFEHGIIDVEVKLRKSNIIQMVCPRLLKPTDIIDPTAILHKPFTTSLGITICAEDTPWAEGTAGFFIAVDSLDKLYLVTTRHVLFPRAQGKHFEHTTKSQPRRNFLVLSEASFQEHLLLIKRETEDQVTIIASQQSRIAGVAGQDDTISQKICEDAELEKRKAVQRAQSLTTFHQELSERCTHKTLRSSKSLKLDDFPGNCIDLGNKYTSAELTRKMRSNPENPHKFTWPGNRLLRLKLPGDSGSVVVDGLGRIGGILTAGSGITDSADVTCVTPIHFIMKAIHQFGPLANPYIKNALPA
ncbi:hypothetical protein BJ322DRAFT_1186070 [Thelephora terrestris]|uniref:Uncharacterized protein n=1 Tax=Thelephora terrestris TaxID=56493 RepID=A0A9P6HH08_9AGAM|nr:hypothetical protein BJ322DRAFT_1186070 [Thelephora terrestris]